MDISAYFKIDRHIQMSIKTVSEGSLFHYTPQIDALKSIIQGGFRYSYAFEEHSKRVSKFKNWSPMDNIELMGQQQPQYGIAFPMICFCDIPISRASEHRAKFGNYCIGVDKEKMRTLLPSLNPVLYYTHKRNTCSQFRIYESNIPNMHQESNWVYHAIETLAEYIPTAEEEKEHMDKINKITEGSKTTVDKASAIINANNDGPRLTLRNSLWLWVCWSRLWTV